MKIIDPSHKWIHLPSREEAYRQIATAMRNCYRAELNAMPATDEQMVEKAIKKGHLSLLEFCTATVNITCDRGVSHELVRHRIAGYAQESTRYCNYSKDKFGRELTFIYPSWTHNPSALDSKKYAIWENAMRTAESRYLEMLDVDATPQEARAVLPNSLATKIAMTANFREWIHVFKLRCDVPAHPDMRVTMIPIMVEMLDRYPSVFQPVYNWLVNRGAVK
jgi:thymidylate synthase (FAD)